MNKEMIVTKTWEDLESLIEQKITKALLGAQSEKEKMSPQTKSYLTREEAAKLIRISKVTLDKWTGEGRIPCHRIGFKKLYRESDILESLETIKANKYAR